MILETFTTLTGDELQLPSFLEINREITGEPNYSMYYLSSRDVDPSMPNHLPSKPTTKAVVTNGMAHDCDA